MFYGSIGQICANLIALVPANCITIGVPFISAVAFFCLFSCCSVRVAVCAIPQILPVINSRMVRLHIPYEDKTHKRVLRVATISMKYSDNCHVSERSADIVRKQVVTLSVVTQKLKRL
jgi:hypothetical protein